MTTARALRAEHRAEHRAELLTTLDDLEARGELIPCRTGSLTDTAAWTSDDDDAQRDAARGCRPCPALADCHGYGVAFPSEAGVLGGVTERDRRQATEANGRNRRRRAAA